MNMRIQINIMNVRGHSKQREGVVLTAAELDGLPPNQIN